MKRIILYIIVAFGLVALLLLAGFFFAVNKTDTSFSEEKVVLQYNRDFQERISEFEKKTEEISTSTENEIAVPEQARLQMEASENFFGTRELADMVKAIDLVKDTIALEGQIDSVQLARSYHALGSFYVRSGGDPRVFKEIFSGDFRQYAAGGNTDEAIRNLSAKAYEISPTARYAIGVALFHANKAIKTQDKQDYDDAVVWLNRADGLAAVNLRGNAFAYLFWRINVLGNLALIDSEAHAQDFEDNYQDTLDFLAETKENHYGAVNGQSLPFMYLQYARFIHQLYGDERVLDVNETLDKLINFVTNDPAQDINEFVVFLRTQQIKEEPDLLAQDIEILADVHLPFTEFLRSYDYQL